MITDVGLNKITMAIKNIIDHGIIVIDGEEKELPINSFNIKDNTLEIKTNDNETNEPKSYAKQMLSYKKTLLRF